MKFRLCNLAFLMVCLLGFSQREASNWYFGKNAGLDFNSGSPVALLDGLLDTVEGCEAFSDANGNLLFYTDGKTVWNRRHQVMLNGLGLKGSFSTSQSALVVPNPRNKNIYYVFTPDDALSQNLGPSNGFNYSVINMGGDSGFGEVQSKNFELLPQCSEKVSAVRNADGDFYWVVTQFRNQFYSYRVDQNGVNTTPVVSTTGPWIQDFENTRGNLKISPDGTKLAISHTIVEPEFEGSFYLFDFDVATGIVSNAQLVSDSRVYYGVEFSSNSSKLYASGLELVSRNGEIGLGPMEIVQFDLDAPNLQDSEYEVFAFPNKLDVFVAGALQIGIDKKIYHSIPNDHLSVIRTPNLKGINVDFRPFGVDLAGRATTYGLPPFIQSFFETIVTIENFCEGSKTTFTTDSTGDISSISWNFGDPVSGTANSSTELNPSHIFSSFGTYTVIIDVEYSNGSSRQFIEFVEIAESPNVVSETELIQCDIDGLDDGITSFNLFESIPLFNNGNEDITALFFATENDALANVNQLDPIGFTNDFLGQEIYARAFENAECFSLVKVKLSTQTFSDLGSYGTFYICEGILGGIATVVDMNEVYDQLNAEFPNFEASAYLDRNDALLELNALPLEDHTFGPLDPLEVYFRAEQDNGCTFIGKVDLNVSQQPDFESTVQINLCNGEAVLTGLEGFDTYLWSNGATEKDIKTTQVGNVDVVFGNGPCSYVQTFEVLPEKRIEVADIVVDDFNRNNRVEVILGPDEELGDFLFSMDGGNSFQPSNTFTSVFPGLYDIIIDNGCSTEERQVLVGGMPAFFTPNNDGNHDRMTLLNAEYFPDYTMSIFDRYGMLLKKFTQQQGGWDGTFLSQDMPAGGYWYFLELADGRSVKGYFTLKR